MIVFDENTTIIAETRIKLEIKMELTNLDIAKVFVNIEIIKDRSNRDITLSQRGYTNKLLDKFVKELPVKSNSCCQEIRLQPNQEKTTPEDI